jgi:hypothetical protein
MSCGELIDTLILIALPASGKSEVRRYIFEGNREDRIKNFHIDENAQLDDFPYVHFMGRTDDELEARGHQRYFFQEKNGRFRFLPTWGVLLRMVNDDYAILKGGLPTPKPDVEAIFARLDKAMVGVGGETFFADMDAGLKAELVTALQPDADFMMNELWEHRPESMEGRTTIIEFARGGPDGAEMPLTRPHGYAWNLSNLAPEILEKAAVLYIWVDPAESRRKNRARYIPGEEGSSLHHMAPEVVMFGDYGTCDIAYLMEQSSKPSTIRIEAHGKTYDLPIARFDNRDDKTSFLHRDPGTWTDGEVGALRGALVGPMADLWDAYHAARHAKE